MTKLRIGLFGAGVVGGGVCELVRKHMTNGRFGAMGLDMEIVKVCVRNAKKSRDFAHSTSYNYVEDIEDILRDESINCVVELIGGTTDAKHVVLQAIKAGKHVVSANKALIASYTVEIQQALAANPSVRFCFEAAVCGGIPIINALQTDFQADEITRVMGIMNGTTNFMLCKMEDEGADYGAVLQEAQKLGFAEADPTADVEGHDVQAKIALVAKLAFGKFVPVSDVPTMGISRITSVDFEYAKLLKSTIKLLGTAILTPAADGSGKPSLAVFVSPAIVPLHSPLAAAKGPGNAVLVHSANMGVSTFSGPGAGRYPTANSVMNDLVRLARERASEPFPLDAEERIVLDSNFSSKFYVRIKCADGLGIVRAVGAAAEEAKVSIHAILQNPISCAHSDIDFIVVTEQVALKNVEEFAAAIAKLSIAKEYPLFMPMI